MLKKICFLVVLLFSSLFTYPPVIAESPRELTYVALGDSLTAGLGSSKENHLRIHGFVPQFTKYLRKDNTITVENYGIPGLTSTGLLALLRADEGLQNRIKTADIISVSIGGNDFLQTLGAFSEDESGTPLELRLDILERTYEEIYKQLRSHNPDTTIILLGLYNPYPTGHQLSTLGEEFAPEFNRILEEYMKESTLFVNPYEVFKGKALEWTHIAKDDIHPNDKGYTQIFHLIKKEYEQLKTETPPS
ncbi:GDSL-type esterase/lipase family protein [Sutcliffiella rhizosphaerae]|uniref:Spore germination lipase LipC n=1 Tax=Sutcliffiella rhizosphaerae TaxID=2880967 RepID=A0ABN8ACA3_9BACI|nr:GDSL-type esterase/lipase family protein [Sutcliffiella rhizosphaerae]CAG9622845.1 Spore germination lipase LipC [Sutcliffiella rhizosphaerae]